MRVSVSVSSPDSSSSDDELWMPDSTSPDPWKRPSAARACGLCRTYARENVPMTRSAPWPASMGRKGKRSRRSRRACSGVAPQMGSGARKMGSVAAGCQSAQTKAVRRRFSCSGTHSRRRCTVACHALSGNLFEPINMCCSTRSSMAFFTLFMRDCRTTVSR